MGRDCSSGESPILLFGKDSVSGEPPALLLGGDWDNFLRINFSKSDIVFLYFPITF